ncbi:Signal transduction histidine kinase [Shimia sagamensis]|uniref:histidine kinase n=2 Tax=Shimia sagamensis TaxID=1566352 RepID=A0ABY1N5J3_9RHOB|nr:Signal transduction histidine kinase [Shimia sagamensis]
MNIRGYLRLRSSLALIILVAAGISAFVVSSEGHKGVMESSVNAQVLGQLLVSTSELSLAFSDLNDPERAQSVNIAEGNLRRNSRVGAAALSEIEDRLARGLFDGESKRVLTQPSLNPVTEFHEILQIAGVAGDTETPVRRKARAGELGEELSARTLPVFMELYQLEVASAEEAGAKQELYTRMALALGAIGVFITIAFVQRPMERFVLRSHSELEASRKEAETARKEAVTARRAAEDDRAMAEAASQAKSAFLATMSHEIRTPLNGVMGVSELLCESEADPERKHMLDLVVKSGNSLLQIINDVLDLAKIEAGKVELVEETFDAWQMCEEVLELFSAQAHRKNIKLSLDTSTDAYPCLCVGYGKPVRQILLNLVNNALKFTDNGAITVFLRRQNPQQPGEQGRLCISVEDTGIGISEDAQSKIFEQFTQADGSTTTKYGGTGLGLSIAQKLCEQIGGKLSVVSQLGHGSTFTVKCPVKCKVGSLKPQTDKLVEDGWTGHVLIADDNKVNLLVASKIVAGLGLTVETAFDGVDALSKFKAGSFDLILMDVRMPNMDGLDATRAIRAYQTAEGAPMTPIVGLSANAMNEHREEGLSSGMSGYLSKPLKKAALVAEFKRIDCFTNANQTKGSSQCA